MRQVGIGGGYLGVFFGMCVLVLGIAVDVAVSHWLPVVLLIDSYWKVIAMPAFYLVNVTKLVACCVSPEQGQVNECLFYSPGDLVYGLPCPQQGKASYYLVSLNHPQLRPGYEEM